MVIAGWLPHTCAPSCYSFLLHLFHPIRNVVHTRSGSTISLYKGRAKRASDCPLVPCQSALNSLRERALLHRVHMQWNWDWSWSDFILFFLYVQIQSLFISVSAVWLRFILRSNWWWEDSWGSCRVNDQRLAKDKGHQWNEDAGQWTLPLFRLFIMIM